MLIWMMGLRSNQSNLRRLNESLNYLKLGLSLIKVIQKKRLMNYSSLNKFQMSKEDKNQTMILEPI